MQLLVCDLDTSLFLMPQHEFLWCRLSKHRCSFRYPCLVSLQYFKNTYTSMHSPRIFFSLQSDALEALSALQLLFYISLQLLHLFGCKYFIHVWCVAFLRHLADYKVSNNKIDLPSVTSCQHFIPLAWESELKYSLIALHLPWIPQRESCIFYFIFSFQVL